MKRDDATWLGATGFALMFVGLASFDFGLAVAAVGVVLMLTADEILNQLDE